MNKNNIFIKFSLLLMFVSFFCTCQMENVVEDKKNSQIKFVCTGKSSTLVISDIHMGDERAQKGIAETQNKSYGWFVNNKEKFLAFLEWVGEKSPHIKEIVIAGDLFDQWVSPTFVDTFPKKADGSTMTHTEFIDSIAAANQTIIDTLINLTFAPHFIKLIYVPGNHDMFVTKEDIERIFNGNMTYIDTYDKDANQKDASGLATYWPNILGETTNRGLVAIEHSHRYDLWNAPDLVTNRNLSGETISADAKLPVGFFVTKMASTHDYEKEKKGNVNHYTKDEFDSFNVGQGSQGDNPSDSDGSINPLSLALYATAWKVLWYKDNDGPIFIKDQAKWNIKTNIDSYNKIWNVNDVYVADITAGRPPLYRSITNYDTWDTIQTNNHVKSKIDFYKGVICSGLTSALDDCCQSQYFDVSGNTAQVVVFGHTHAHTCSLKTGTNNIGYIYANSGTWVDDSSTGTCNFVLIQPEILEKRLTVGAYTYYSHTETSFDIKSTGGLETINIQ